MPDYEIAPDEQVEQAQFKLDGQWLPSVDPVKIGPNNYQVLQNLRYRKGDGGPEGVDGYTEVNETALSSYPLIKSGIQLRNYLSDTFSWVVVQSQDSGGTQRLYVNKTDIPDQGDFESTALHTPATGASVGRFSRAPQGNISYANGKESYIWAGDAYDIAAFFLCDDSSLTNPKEYTVEVRDDQDDSDYRMTWDSSTTPYAVLLSRRKLKGANIVVHTVNATTATITGNVYTSSGFAAVSNPSDGTDVGGVALAQSGTFSFDSTVDTAIPMHFEGYYAYAYRFQLSAGSAIISHVTVDAPFQPMTDLWDGVSRQPDFVRLSYNGTAEEDFTAYILNPSDIQYPIGLDLSGTTTSGVLEFVFEERASAIDVNMLGTLVNTAATTLTIKYWSGSAYVACSNAVDGTSGFKKSGRIKWTPPASTAERKVNLDDHFGYAYQITFADASVIGSHGNKSVIADVITAITAQYVVPAFDWTSTFKNRLLGIRGNELFYTPPGFADSWNGKNSSMGGVQTWEFGPGDPLTCGSGLYNRYGSSVFEVWVVFSDSKAFQLKGGGPLDENDPFNDDTISENVGCPAPLTLCSAEIGFEISADAKRNILLWISSSGPMAYDGAVLYPIGGIEKFFDPNDSECINFDYIEESRGWYDPIYREWNIVFPSGVGQSTPNKWLVYDLEKQRWYQKSTGSQPIPICGFQTTDSMGNQFVYGGVSDGTMVRLEYGASWNGIGITEKIVCGDFWPDGNVWHKSEIRRIKWVCRKTTTDHKLTLLYRSDTIPTDSIGTLWEDTLYATYNDTVDCEWDEPNLTTMNLYSANSDRLVRRSVATNLIAWTHAIGGEVTTTTEHKCFQPMALAIEHKQATEDY